jgi:hypothetical protein
MEKDISFWLTYLMERNLIVVKPFNEKGNHYYDCYGCYIQGARFLSCHTIVPGQLILRPVTVILYFVEKATEYVALTTKRCNRCKIKGFWIDKKCVEADAIYL